MHWFLFTFGLICNEGNFHLNQLDESTARQQLKSPRSLSGRSIHLTLVTKWSWSWSWMIYCHTFCAMSIGPPILRYNYIKFDHHNPWSRPCVWSKVKVTFDLQHSNVKVIVKVKPIGHIWGLEFNRYVCFSFHGNRTTFGWDIANFIFDLENSKVKVMAKVKPDGHIWGLEFNRYVCFLFRGNRIIFGWDIANSIFDLENSRSKSWPRSNPMAVFTLLYNQWGGPPHNFCWPPRWILSKLPPRCYLYPTDG